MRVDERTEISMTRHHLQGGVSGVKRGRLPSEVEPHAKNGRDEATADTSESDGLGRFVGSRRKWRAYATPARPPLPPPTAPPPFPALSCQPPERLRPTAPSLVSSGGWTRGPLRS